jgi:hypothetical protein
LFIQKSIKDEKAGKSGKKRNSGKRAEKRGNSGNFPQKAEEVATLVSNSLQSAKPFFFSVESFFKFSTKPL